MTDKELTDHKFTNRKADKLLYSFFRMLKLMISINKITIGDQ